MGTLQPKSENQILGEMIQLILSQIGANDLNPGSILLTLLEAAASQDYSQYYQMLQILRNYNIDTTTGSDLDNRALEYGLTRIAEQQATGQVSIMRPAGFVAISTGFYIGFRAPLAGDTVIYVNDASNKAYGTSGSLIIGRGTVNQETVGYTSAPVNNTNYWTITLSTPLFSNHSLSESITLVQGTMDIVISAGTSVQVPATSRTVAVIFQTTQQVTLLAGAASVDNVDVKCIQAGIDGNIPIGAITGTSAFLNPPFIGAQATNLLPFTSGSDRGTDTQLRNSIKSYIQGLSQATTSGISYAIIGLVDPITSKRVVSANIVQPITSGQPVKIFIDDGTGFEPSFLEVGQETVVPAANGTEVRLQLQNFPVVKAFLETGNSEPFNMSSGNLTLSYIVGNQSETITFTPSMFNVSSAASAYEIASAINALSTLIDSRTTGDGSRVVIEAAADTNESLQITGGSANAANILDFPTNLQKTIYLYKNDKILVKDGLTATLIGTNQQPFNLTTPSSSQILTVTVDGKSANVQTVSLAATLFVTPASVSAAQVAAVINTQLAGAMAYAVNGYVQIVSNQALTTSSSIQVSSTTGATTLGLSTSEVSGAGADYTLNPELGLIQLTNPLVADDLITAGTRNTRAFLTASIPQTYTFVGGEILKIVVDAGSTQTITFTAASGQSAVQAASQINSQLVGGTAVTRTIGANTFVEIRTNTYDSTGSIEILSSGTTANGIFGFVLDSIITNVPPHTAYLVSNNGGPYNFAQGQTLTVIVDNNPSGDIFIITINYPGSVTSASSSSVFANSAYSSIFDLTSELVNYWVVFTSGANTVSGTVVSSALISGNTWQYFFQNPPTGFQNYAIGDQVTLSSMQNAGNNGSFIITGITTQGTVWPNVLTQTISNPATLTPTTGNRYLINTNAGTSLGANVQSIAVSNPSALTPTAGQQWIVAPAANTVMLTPVIGEVLDSASAVEVNGNRYLINGTGVNDFAGHNQNIATYNGVGTPGWIFYTPNDQDVVKDSVTGVIYQFSSGSGTWVVNLWGGSANDIATYSSSSPHWSFTQPNNNEVHETVDTSTVYEYNAASALWSANVWGGLGNEIAQWTGSSWSYTVPSTNDVVTVTDVSQEYQWTGSIWTPFAFYVQVTNASGFVEAGSHGTGLLGERRQVSAYNALTGGITVSSAFTNTASVSDSFVVMPGTRANVVDYFNNQSINSLSSAAFIELSDQGSEVQISSQSNGSDGYVQVAGGLVNSIMDFSTTQVQGAPAYSYYTGLTKLVSQTIYGDETDFVAFPGTGAAGIDFKILAPTVNEVSFAITVTLSAGVSITGVENDILSAATTYVNGLGVGQNVVLSQLSSKILAVTGVTDVDITSPNSNVIVQANQIARTNPTIITITNEE